MHVMALLSWQWVDQFSLAAEAKMVFSSFQLVADNNVKKQTVAVQKGPFTRIQGLTETTHFFKPHWKKIVLTHRPKTIQML